MRTINAIRLAYPSLYYGITVPEELFIGCARCVLKSGTLEHHGTTKNKKPIAINSNLDKS